MPPKPAVDVFFTPEFKRNLRALAKKYSRIRSDVQPIIEQIQHGEFVGDQVQGTGYTIFKVRIRNSDTTRDLLFENSKDCGSHNDLLKNGAS
jgi:mRNA-degrading endonuclease RelE of RelBE toxin-antitoxin system